MIGNEERVADIEVEELRFQGQKAGPEPARGRGGWSTVVVVALCFCYAVTLLAVVVVVMVQGRNSVIRACVESGGSWTAQNECTRTVAAVDDGATVG